jgi:hypothetical protein
VGICRALEIAELPMTAERLFRQNGLRFKVAARPNQDERIGFVAGCSTKSPNTK